MTMNSELKVLVVDDEPDIIEILSYNLTKENYKVFYASSGMECLQSALKVRPDLIIMDIRMPGMSGIEACREIKATESLRNTPVLFLTADADEYTTMNAMEAGGNHFVTKPIHPKLLLGMIKEIIK